MKMIFNKLFNRNPEIKRIKKLTKNMIGAIKTFSEFYHHFNDLPELQKLDGLFDYDGDYCLEFYGNNHQRITITFSSNNVIYFSSTFSKNKKMTANKKSFDYIKNQLYILHKEK